MIARLCVVALACLVLAARGALAMQLIAPRFAGWKASSQRPLLTEAERPLLGR